MQQVKGIQQLELSDNTLAQLGLSNPLHRRRVLREVQYILEEGAEAAEASCGDSEGTMVQGTLPDSAGRHPVERQREAAPAAGLRFSLNEAPPLLQPSGKAVPAAAPGFSLNEAPPLLQPSEEASIAAPAPRRPAAAPGRRGRYGLAGGRVAPVKAVQSRRASLFSFRHRQTVEPPPLEACGDDATAPDAWERGISEATADGAQEGSVMSHGGSEADGGLDWDRWLEYRLAPGGPLVLVEALRSAGLAGRPEELRAAIAQVEAQGERLLVSLDSSPCPEEMLCSRAAQAGGRGSTPGLWTWATDRLKALEAAEEELGVLLLEVSGVLEKCRKKMPKIDEEPTQRLGSKNARGSPGHFNGKLQFLDSVKQGVVRCVSLENPSHMENNRTVRHMVFVRLQEHITDEENLLLAHLSALDEEVGLRGPVREKADETLRMLKDAQEEFFDGFVEFRAHIEKELQRYGAPGFEFSPLELAQRLERIIQIAMREIGARVLLGDAAFIAADKQGVGLNGGSEPNNPWKSLKRNPPPWEGSFLQALARLAQLRRASIVGEVFIPWEYMESARETRRRFGSKQASGSFMMQSRALSKRFTQHALEVIRDAKREGSDGSGLSDVSDP